jgi:hypothetical protein
MTNKLKSKLLGAAIIVFMFGIPAFVTFTTYVTLETTTSEVTASLIGIVVLGVLALVLIKWLKKRVRNKIDSGLIVSPYYILFLNNTFGLVLYVLFVWFIGAIRADIDVFYELLIIITICEIIAYGLKYWQTYYDILIKKESTQ